jgi:hypothetical protein
MMNACLQAKREALPDPRSQFFHLVKLDLVQCHSPSLKMKKAFFVPSFSNEGMTKDAAMNAAA